MIFCSPSRGPSVNDEQRQCRNGDANCRPGNRIHPPAPSGASITKCLPLARRRPRTRKKVPEAVTHAQLPNDWMLRDAGHKQSRSSRHSSRKDIRETQERTAPRPKRTCQQSQPMKHSMQTSQGQHALNPRIKMYRRERFQLTPRSPAPAKHPCSAYRFRH